MNDKDKEAFDMWYRKNCKEAYASLAPRDLFITWQAACEYKDKNNITFSDYDLLFNDYKKLQAENEKLMLIAEYYANSDEVGAYARKILKELEQL